jgi:hypothetical protein
MIDPNDKTWHAVKEHVEARLKDAVSALKSPKTDYPDTQRLRGRIEELEGLLALAPIHEVEAVIPADSPSY